MVFTIAACGGDSETPAGGETPADGVTDTTDGGSGQPSGGSNDGGNQPSGGATGTGYASERTLNKSGAVSVTEKLANTHRAFRPRAYS